MTLKGYTCTCTCAGVHVYMRHFTSDKVCTCLECDDGVCVLLVTKNHRWAFSSSLTLRFVSGYREFVQVLFDLPHQLEELVILKRFTIVISDLRETPVPIYCSEIAEICYYF